MLKLHITQTSHHSVGSMGDAGSREDCKGRQTVCERFVQRFNFPELQSVFKTPAYAVEIRFVWIQHVKPSKIHRANCSFWLDDRLFVQRAQQVQKAFHITTTKFADDNSPPS